MSGEATMHQSVPHGTAGRKQKTHKSLFKTITCMITCIGICHPSSAQRRLVIQATFVVVFSAVR